MRERQTEFVDLFARGSGQTKIMSVTDLTNRIKSLIEDGFDRIWVSGEISGIRRQSSGHFYMVLKDERASIQAVLFRGQASKLKFDPEDGMEVMAAGRLSVYAPRGQYQLVVDYLEPRGEGALHLAFGKLKARLKKEGLFDSSLKKEIPKLPEKIGVVTSPTGAAIRDFLRILHRRNPNISVLVAPARVQGEGAASEIAMQLKRLDDRNDMDLIVLTRGGGSIEDLWAFNEEESARAIAACRTPVVSAVGHEIDFTIADMVADLRASTPSAAAEILTPEYLDMQRELRKIRDRLDNAMLFYVEKKRSSLRSLGQKVPEPVRILNDCRFNLEACRERMENAMREGLIFRERKLVHIRRQIESAHPAVRFRRLAGRLHELESKLTVIPSVYIGKRQRGLRELYERMLRKNPAGTVNLERKKIDAINRAIIKSAEKRLVMGRQHHASLFGKLNGLSPLGVLERGYALVMSEKGKVIRSFKEVENNEKLNIRVAEGRIRASVLDVEG